MFNSSQNEWIKKRFNNSVRANGKSNIHEKDLDAAVKSIII